MVVERSLQTLNATIAGVKARVAALEKRKAGGSGTTIYVGPDYRGDGPKLVVPAIPNPSVPTDHAIRRVPIVGLHLYQWDKTSKNLLKYNFDNETWSDHTINDPDIKTGFQDSLALNGWSVLSEKKFVNLRTKQVIKTESSIGVIGSLAEYRYMVIYPSRGNTAIYDTKGNVGPKGLSPISSEYEYIRFIGLSNAFYYHTRYDSNVKYIVIYKIVSGVPVEVSKVEEKKIEPEYEVKSLTAQGNILASKRRRKQGEPYYALFSGVDGRKLGHTMYSDLVCGPNGYIFSASTYGGVSYTIPPRNKPRP